jgi:hypothetical protein
VLLFLLLLVFLVDLLLEYAYVDFTDILGLYAGLSRVTIKLQSKLDNVYKYTDDSVDERQ